MATATQGFPLDLPITVHQGAYYEERHEDVDTTGAVISYEGWDGVLHVRDEVGGTLVWAGTTDNGRLVVGDQDDGAGTTWQVLISIPATDTEALPAGFVGVYECKLRDTTGRWHSYLKGQFCVDGEVADV